VNGEVVVVVRDDLVPLPQQVGDLVLDLDDLVRGRASTLIVRRLVTPMMRFMRWCRA
jgi:hypothetical protein